MRSQHAKILGVAVDASEQEVRAAFKKAALRWHPDMKQGCARRYGEARQAMESMLHAPASESFRRSRARWAHEESAHEESAEARREYERERQRGQERARQEARNQTRERPEMLRGLKLLCAYVILGGAVKCAMLALVDRTRDADEAIQRGLKIKQHHTDAASAPAGPLQPS